MIRFTLDSIHTTLKKLVMVSSGVAYNIQLCDYNIHMHCGTHCYVEGDRNPPYKYENQQCLPIPYIISQLTAERDISLAFHLLIVACGGTKKSP